MNLSIVKNPFGGDLNETEAAGTIVGLTTATTIAIICLPVMPLPAFLFLSGGASLVGSFIGCNGAGHHSSGVLEASIKAFLEVGSLGLAANYASNIIHHARHFVNCKVCGKIYEEIKGHTCG